jgi:hypothetical protein
VSSHVCNVCGLVVSLTSSQPRTSLPLDGCCIRNDVQPMRSHRHDDDQR